MKQSESIKNIGAAMLQFHAEVGKIKKSSTNPFFNSKYASLPNVLDGIEEPLQKAGLTFMQFPEEQNNLTTIILHPESGEWISSTFYMKPTKEDPQGYGSTITYQRRYALGAILGLNIDVDDDGKAGSVPIKNTEKPELTPDSAAWVKAVNYLKEGEGTIENVESKYTLTKENKEELCKQSNI